MKADELREKTDAELSAELAALRDELFKLRFRHATHQLDNPMLLRKVRRDIARVMTIQRGRELAAAAGKN
ncbi:MAG: 50S ribosomal protein L29 [Clostridiaceae bacterium]|jgi:large subunit ribosomal protein L29|nr:50S ribosomal protein L29 [Clostridiaceae bacterium]NLZ70813.1 50S ribosomal protein L29 [Clostridiaceae bacterium]